MTTMATVGYDVMHANIGVIPLGSVVAGYSTGSAEIVWTAADWQRFPNALRIDQDPLARDPTADYLDVEAQAATPAECAAWAKAAIADFNSVKRPGQRMPAIYMSGNNVTAVVNGLLHGGVKSGVGLVVANWGLSVAQALAMVENAGGPFPIVGVQFNDTAFSGDADTDAFSVPWMDKRSHKAPPPPPPGKAFVPPCIGKDAGAAHNAIIAAHLTPTAVKGQTPREICTATTPGAGNTVKEGSDVQIVASPPQLVKQGSAGNWVRLAQTDLNKAGMRLVVDGDFGGATNAAVIAFQAGHHIGIDGIVGPATWYQLGLY